MYQIANKQPRDHTFKTAGEAWRWALGFISEYGSVVKTEDGYLTREYRNLLLTVNHPWEGWPIDGSGWDMEGLDRYGEQILSGENLGFDYTYGERMTLGLPGTEHDQIEAACRMLIENPNTRRAPIWVWLPSDLWTPEHHPCMMIVDPLIRDGRLHLAAMFRSHDLERAYPQNLYGLHRLQDHMLGRINEHDLGIAAGSISTWSVSAHRYYQ